jgi:ribonuclease Z
VSEPGAEKPVAFTLVGSGAVRVNPRRGGPAQILEIDGRPILIDCGRGAVDGVVQCGYEIEEIDRMFVTHLHFDHVCDLPYFALLAWNNNPHNELCVHVPTGLEHFLHHAVREAYKDDIASRLGHGKSADGLDVEVVEIGAPGVVLEQDNCTVSTLVTPHAAMLNLNYRFDACARRVVVTSDTQPHPDLAAFCKDADLLVCECSGTAEFLSGQPWGGWHMNPQTVAQLACEANVKRVVLKHFVIENFTDAPDIADQMAQAVRQTYPGEVIVGVDGLRIEL